MKTNKEILLQEIKIMIIFENVFNENELKFVQDDETCIWVYENGNLVAEVFINKHKGKVIEVDIDPKFNIEYGRIKKELFKYIVANWEDKDFEKLKLSFFREVEIKVTEPVQTGKLN